MNKCDSCDQSLPADGNHVICYSCNKSMHFGTNCSGLAERTWRAKSVTEKESWLCKSCRRGRINSSEEAPASSDLQWGLAQIKESLEKVFKMQFETINNKLDQTLSQLQSALTEIDELRGTNRKLMEENQNLREKVIEIESEVNHLSQYSRNRNVELHGIPQRPNEDIEALVMNIGKKLQVQVSPKEFVAHRLGAEASNRHRPILIQFDSRKARDSLMKSGKRLKLKLKDVDSDFGEGPLYINDNLTPYYKKLLFRAKEVRQKLNYKYLWVANSKVLMKKDDSSRPVRIVSENDLLKLELNTVDLPNC
jgi:FtsZ-binding cell division protein ZapB